MEWIGLLVLVGVGFAIRFALNKNQPEVDSCTTCIHLGTGMFENPCKECSAINYDKDVSYWKSE